MANPTTHTHTHTIFHSVTHAGLPNAKLTLASAAAVAVLALPSVKNTSTPTGNPPDINDPGVCASERVQFTADVRSAWTDATTTSGRAGGAFNRWARRNLHSHNARTNRKKAQNNSDKLLCHDANLEVFALRTGRWEPRRRRAEPAVGSVKVVVGVAAV